MAERRQVRCRIVSASPEDTYELGYRLGEVAEPGDAFLLEGEFGAGKTVFVQGLARGLGIESPVASPAFVIINQHDGRLRLFHVDLYRAERLDPELEDTVADVLEAGGVTAIEWPQLLPADLRAGATTLRITRQDGEQRLIELETPHSRLAAVVEGGTRAARD